MANERYNVVIGMALEENGVVQQALNARTKVEDVFREMNTASSQGGGFLDPAQIERFAARLKAAVKEAFNLDLSNSQVMQAMRTNQNGRGVPGFSKVTMPAILGADATQSSKFLAEQIRVFTANQKKAEVDAKSMLPIGHERGYQTINDRTNAQAQAALRVELANRQMERAILKDVTAQTRLADREAAERQSYIDKINQAHYKRIQAEDAAARQAEVATAKERQNNLDKINQAHYARIQAEDKLARLLEEQAAKAQEADQAAGNFKVSYPGAVAKDAMGRGQVGVNNAERALEIATLARTKAYADETRSTESLLAADRRLEAAKAMLTGAEQRLADIEARSGQQGLMQQFHAGFRGQSDTPYAAQIGQALKFSLFYGTAYKMMFAFTQTLQQTLQEGIAFQQAMTELRLSAGDANHDLDQLGQRLGDSSVEAGFAPSQGVLVGARSLGLYGATGAHADTQAQVALISARVVSRLALTSGQDPAELQANVAAITQAFGGGAQAQYRVADLDAYMAHKFGIAPGQSIQAVSEAGTVGRAAGFSQEEVNAIAADLISRTGQTAPAVAGFMAQIFSRGGEGSLTGVATKYGIDPTLELSQQIKQLADVYKTASPQERAQLSAAFGRGKVQNAAIALLQDYGSVQSAATAARGGAADGAADTSFSERMSNIGGQIAATTGALKDFANELGQSGLLDLLGIGVVVFRDLVQAGTGLLKIWNELPHAIRDVIVGLGLMAGAYKVAGGAEMAASVFGRVGIGRATAPLAAAAGRGAIMATDAAGMAVPLASGAGVRAAGGAIAGALLNPVTLAIGGLVAIGALKNTSDRLANAQDFATKTLRHSIPGAGATSDDYRSRATALREAAQGQRDATSGLWNSRVSMVTGDYDSARASASRLGVQATADDIIAKATDRWNAEAAAKAPASVISGFDSQSLSDSMTQITNAGGTATDRMRALTQAIHGTGVAAGDAAKAFNPGHFAVQAQEGVLGAISTALKGTKMKDVADFTSSMEVPNLHVPWGLGSHMVDNTDSWVRDKFDPASVIRSMRNRLGNTNLGTASGEDLDRIASGVLDDSGLNLTGDDLKKAHAALVKFLQKEAARVRGLIDGARDLSGPEVTADVNRLVQDSEEAAGNLQQTDFSGKVSNARNRVRGILAILARAGTGQDTNQAYQQLDLARRNLAQSQFDEMEQLRKVAQQNAHSKADIARIGQRYLNREIRAAVRNGNTDVLASIVAQAGKGSIAIARAAIDDEIATINAALAVKHDVDQIRNKFDSDLGGASFHVSRKDAARDKALRQRRDRLQDQRSGLDDLLHATGTDNVYKYGGDVPGANTDTQAEIDAARAAALAVKSGSAEAAARAAVASARAAVDKTDKNSVAYWNAMGELWSKQQDLAHLLMERGPARAAAMAVKSGSAVDAARASISGARVAMAEADKDSAAYWNAVGQLYSGQQTLADALLERARNAMLLGVDMTNPLAMARVDLNMARKKLAADRKAGKSPEVINADVIATRNAEANRESTAFQQRLQSVQTADQLGRISHQKYLNYLQNEHNRLEAVKHRTFQQQQELDQIDGLMKDAASAMDAQWNFGDIKLPTPYQVRRYIEQTGPGKAEQLANQTAGAVHHTQIYIDGADTGKVKKIVEEVTGKAARTLTSTPRRR